MDPVAILTDAVTDLGTTLTGVAGPALGIGAAVLGLGFGWRLVKKFSK